MTIDAAGYRERREAALQRAADQAVEDAEQLTRALGALAGSVLRTVRVTASAPGSHTVSIEAGDAAIRVVFERGGARLAGVDVGVGGVGE